MTEFSVHRLNGLEPDNLLGFMALLGLLRVLEEVRPDWRVRVHWTLDDPPLRPVLRTPIGENPDTIAVAVAEGLDVLAKHHEFEGVKDLSFSPKDAADNLIRAARSAGQNRYVADLWSALVSDAAVTWDGKKVERTPLCLMFGQGNQHFLERLNSVPRLKVPPKRFVQGRKIDISEKECICEALFKFWNRLDLTHSFRWDPVEDVRYALRARNPTDRKTKETKQHGANRLAAIGLSVLTTAPTIRSNKVKLAVLGGRYETNGEFVFRWPIWREPISLTSIRALLGHPGLDNRDSLVAFGIAEIRQARRISAGRYINFTRAETIAIL